MSPVYDLPDGPFSPQTRPIGDAPVWSATRYIRTDHLADEPSDHDSTVIEPVINPVVRPGVRPVGGGPVVGGPVVGGLGPVDFAVPPSSANLDYQSALHTNAGVHQRSLREFLI